MTTLASRPAAATDDRPLGTVHIADSAVAKIAAYIAGEMPEIGRPTRGIGRLPGSGMLGTGQADLGRGPAVSAHIDRNHVSVDVKASVLWGASVPEATSRLRQQLRDRLKDMTGLTVDEVHVDVTDLISQAPPSTRVS